jgi:hypothetical protein
MTKRSVSLFAALALSVSACAAGPNSGSSTTTPPAETTTTSARVEAVQLSYALAAGDELRYEIQLDQHIEMTATGDPSAMGDEEMPGAASIDLSGSGVFTQAVSDGPTPGTYEIHITGEVTDLSVTGTADGEPIDTSDVPDFAEIQPVDVTVVVDEQGNVVDEAGGGEDPMAGMLGGLGALGEDGSIPGMDFTRFLGVPLSDEEVTVGDTWSEEIETPGLTEEPIVTTIQSTVTGVDQVDGADVFVIETVTTTTPIEFDLAEFFSGMFGAFLPEDATDEEVAAMEAALAEMRFLISIDGSTAENTTLFDAEAGLVRKLESSGGTTVAMDVNIPDEETQELVAFTMNMSLDQNATFKLVSGPTA